MIKEKVRKEICLLLILAVIISLTSSHAVYAAAAGPAVSSQKLTTKESASRSERGSIPVSPASADTHLTVNTDIPDVNEPTVKASSVDQTDPTGQPAVNSSQPVLNTTQLHLIAGGAPYELHVANAVNANYELSAVYPSIATLSNVTTQSVTITPIAAGQTVLSVSAVAADGSQVELSCQIIISELSLTTEAVDLYINDTDPSTDVTIQGIDLDTVYYESGDEWKDERIRDVMNESSQCTIRTGNPKVADAWFSDGSIHIKGLARGITNVRIKIYDVPLSIRVSVHHYTLNKYTINTYIGSSMKSLKVKGTDGHKVIWVSGNKKVATVSKTGIVTIKGVGTTKITAKVNGRKVICIVSVSSKTAYRVVRDARAISKKKNIQYSQAMRMSKNYYDCSSLVYRCYKPYGIRFGYTHPTWAPTAADECRWCVISGHQVSAQAESILSCKLRAGDTIYYSFNGNNGRYLNIDHTAIFAGYEYDPSIGYYGTVIEASSSSNTVTERMYYDSDSIKLIGRPSRK